VYIRYIEVARRILISKVIVNKKYAKSPVVRAYLCLDSQKSKSRTGVVLAKNTSSSWPFVSELVRIYKGQPGWGQEVKG
jgi:hypothetical protein